MQELAWSRLEGSRLLLLLALLAPVPLTMPGAANAQFAERMGNAAVRAAESEAHRQVDRAVRNAIRCAVGDRICQERARKEGKDVVLVDSQGNPLDDGRSHWHLAFAGQQWNGDKAHVIEDDLLFALHLTSEDDATLYLFLAEDGEGDQDARGAFLAFDSEERCRYPFVGAPSFRVWLDRSDGQWISGSYDGTVRCEYRSAPTRASGTFRVPRH
jgi:hypothetical protein